MKMNDISSVAGSMVLKMSQRDGFSLSLEQLPAFHPRCTTGWLDMSAVSIKALTMPITLRALRRARTEP